MNAIFFDRNILSSFLDIVCKLEIGQKFAGLLRSRSGFFNNDVTLVDL